LGGGDGIVRLRVEHLAPDDGGSGFFLGPGLGGVAEDEGTPVSESIRIIGFGLVESFVLSCGLGELLVGLLAGNLGFLFGNAGLTVLREGDNLRKISEVALTTSTTLANAARQVLHGREAERVAAALTGIHGVDFISIYTFVDLLSRIAILILLFLVGLETSLAESVLSRVQLNAHRA
jgi:Kef-type K+ transport system membrane component KefB